MTERLLTEACRFEFFQAVRLIQRAASANPVGRDQLPEEEALRFCGAPSLGFPSSSIVGIKRRPPEASKGPEFEMVVAFMGLAGPSGVLPAHYTRLLIERIRRGDYALRDFFDMFNHRLISLFFRAWEKCHFPAAYERARRERAEDLLSTCLYSLIGFGTAGVRGRLQFPDEALLRYVGFLADRHRPAICLQQMLCDHFNVPVAIEQLCGQWLPLEPRDQSALSGENGSEGRYDTLGMDLVVGDAVWDVQGMFRVRIGPLTYGEFCDWIPNADALRPLCQLVRTYVGLEFQFDVQVVLKGPEIPPCFLGGPPEEYEPLPGCTLADYEPLLGWTTWLLTEKADQPLEDAEDAVFSLDDV